MTTYRLNRVPDKIYVRLLELLGVSMRPATPARTHVRFTLAAPPIEPITIAAGDTEVGTVRTAYEESVVFEVVESRTIEPLQPSAYVVHRDGERRNIAVDAGVARPIGADRAAFSAVPVAGDAMHLGFDKPLSRLLMSILVEAEPARGAGVDPRRPPLRWEMAAGESPAGELVWEPVTVLDDTTGGFNFGSGEVLLELAGDSERVPLDGHRLHWLRCRVATPEEAGGAAYERPPEVFTITGGPIGAILVCQHAEHVDGETIGESDGTPGQSSRSCARRCSRRPTTNGSRCATTSAATGSAGAARDLRRERPGDRVYVCDAAHGTIELGRPCARPTARGATTARCRRRARRCGCRATAPAAGCAATSRRAR